MDISPEWRLLLACARANLTADDLRQITQDLVRADLDWDHVVKIAYAQGIAPLIYHSLLRSAVTKLLPPVAEDALRNSYYANAARNSLLYDELRGVLTGLIEEKIDVIVLKGAALAETVYSHRTLRPMADVDLLVKKERLAEVEATLLNMGYVCAESLGTKEWLQQHYYHLVFVKSSSIRIEVHWHIGPRSRLRMDMNDLWQRAQPTNIAGVGTLIFSPEDILFHVCQHACKHGLMGGIRPLCDIAEATKFYANKIDWRKLGAVSAQWQNAPWVYIGLYLARDLLDAPIPESCLKELEPVNFDPALIRWARERILTKAESSPVFADLVQLFCKGQGFKERLAVAQKALSLKTTARYGRHPSESKRSLFYYPLRIQHLLTRYGSVVWQLLAGNQKMRAAADREKDQLQLTKWLSSG